jgi:hypothetical protein
VCTQYNTNLIRNQRAGRRIAPTMQVRAVGSPAVTRPPSPVPDLADGAGGIPCPKQEDQPQRRTSLASIAVRIIPLGASIAYAWPMPPEPGHLSIAPPPLALLHLATTGRAGRHRRCLRAGQHKLVVYHCFPHSPPPQQGYATIIADGRRESVTKALQTHSAGEGRSRRAGQNPSLAVPGRRSHQSRTETAPTMQAGAIVSPAVRTGASQRFRATT